MDTDKTDRPKAPGPRTPRATSDTDLPSSGPDSPVSAAPDLDPATSPAEEDEEARLPDLPDQDLSEDVAAVAEGPLAVGHAPIENPVRLAPTSPRVSPMLDAANDAPYLGQA